MLEIGDAAVNPAPDPLVRQERKPTLDLGDLGGGRRGEVDLVARALSSQSRMSLVLCVAELSRTKSLWAGLRAGAQGAILNRKVRQGKPSPSVQLPHRLRSTGAF